MKINLLSNRIAEKLLRMESFFETCRDIESAEEFFEYWTSAVTVKWHTPSGLFSTGSAEEIASTLKKVSNSYKQAVSRLIFYKSRGGKNLSPERIKVLDKAYDILKQLFGKE